MKRVLGAALMAGLVAAASAQAPPTAKPAPGQAGGAGRETPSWPAEWPKLPAVPTEEGGPPESPAPLPKPTLTEPAAIGIALHEPGNVGVGVVSLLRLMGIGIDAPGNATAPAGAAKAGPGLRLSESEVRGLIAMGVADAEATDDDKGPYSFADLYGAVAPMLPGATAESLAEKYATAYDDDPESLAAQVMQGTPIEAKTVLLRTQIWLLLMDGFGTPGTAGAGAGARWGTAKAKLKPLASPDPRWTDTEWSALIGHVMLLGFRAPFDVMQVGRSEPDGPLTLEVRLDAPAPAILAPGSGKVLLAPRSGGFEGRPVTWNSSDAEILRERGTVEGALGTPMRTDRTGAARLVFVPKPDDTAGEGAVVTERPTVSAAIGLWDLASSRYDLPASTKGFLIGTATASRTIRVRTRTLNAFHLRILNEYDARLDMGPLGLATRDGGFESLDGTLARQRDGTYRGVMWTYCHVDKQTLSGLGQRCEGEIMGSQELLAIGRIIDRHEFETTWLKQHEDLTALGTKDKPAKPPAPSLLNPPAAHLPWSEKTSYPIGSYLRLEFYAATDPHFLVYPLCPAIDDWSGKGVIIGDTLSARDGGYGPGNMNQKYLPMKDPRWTRPELGLVIPIPAAGGGSYRDIEFPKGSPVGSSIWYVSVLPGRRK